jgi:transcriptional regulator with XRE-family HTH domain
VTTTTVSTRLWDYNLLRRWRDEAGLKPAPVAAHLDISVAWLYQIEGGTNQRGVSVDLLIRLCRFYGHELAELIIPADQVAEREAAEAVS